MPKIKGCQILAACLKRFAFALVGVFFIGLMGVSSALAEGFNSTANSNLPIGAGGNTVMMITPGGNVGIGKGTASPAAPLDVNGNAIVGGTLSVSGTVLIGTQTARPSTVSAANALADALNSSGCPAGAVLTVGAGGTVVCSTGVCNNQEVQSPCNPPPAHSTGSTQICTGDQWAACTVTGCASGYYVSGSVCAANVCTPNQWTQNGCSTNITGGIGQQQCNATGSGYTGSCALAGCDSSQGYVLVGNTCLSQVCTPNQPYYGDPSTYAVCNTDIGYGHTTCNGNGTGNTGACYYTSCSQTNYTPSNGGCVYSPPLCTPYSSNPCSIANGSGQQTCNSNGSAWGACSYSCNSGYTWNGSSCVANTCAAGVTVSWAPRNPRVVCSATTPGGVPVDSHVSVNSTNANNGGTAFKCTSNGWVEDDADYGGADCWVCAWQALNTQSYPGSGAPTINGVCSCKQTDQHASPNPISPGVYQNYSCQGSLWVTSQQ